MKLLTLMMKNFIPYKGEQEVRFPQDPNRNVMVVFGDNMRGKTSLLNAIRWVFYGRAYGRHLREIGLPDLHNKDAVAEGDWEMEVAITFEADGHGYELRRRSVKKHLVSMPTRNEDFDQIVALQRDGLSINGHLVEAELNKFVPEQVSRFFLFDGELLQEYETLLIEGSDQGKNIKVAIEQVLGVPALVRGRDVSTTLLRTAQKIQTKDLAQVSGLERQAENQASLQTRQAASEADLTLLKRKLNDTNLQRTELDDELEKTEAAQRAKGRIDALESRKENINLEHKSKSNMKLELLSHAWRDLLQAKLKVKRDQLRLEQQRLLDLIGKRSTLEARIQNLETMLSTDVCPTCEQSIALERKKTVGAQLGTIQAELLGLSVDQSYMVKVSTEISEVEKLLVNPVGPQIRQIAADIRRLEVELTKVENDIEGLLTEVQGFDDVEVARKRALRQGLVKSEILIEQNILTTQSNLDTIKRELQIIAKSIQGMPQARAQRSTVQVNVLMKLEKSFSESIERLRDALRLRVQEKATQAFKQMISQKAYDSLKINENYGLTILDENRRPVSIRSAGAEQIVALSLIDGLSRTGRKAGPVVMDTPFGRLDTTHRENILRYLPTAANQLILLVHDGEIRKEIDLAAIASRVGAEYVIKEKGPRHSTIERSIS